MTAFSRPATAADIAQYFEGIPTPTMRAWVLERDGELLGIGGLSYRAGDPKLFMDWQPEAEKYPIALYKAARGFLASIDNGNLYAYACSSKACKLLTRLGLKHLASLPDQEVFVWQP